MSKFLETVRQRFTGDRRSAEVPFNFISTSVDIPGLQIPAMQRKVLFSASVNMEAWCMDGDGGEYEVLLRMFMDYLREMVYGDLRPLMRDLSWQLQQRNYGKASEIVNEMYDIIHGEK